MKLLIKHQTTQTTLGVTLFLGSVTGLSILYGTDFWNRGYVLWGIPRFLEYFTVLSNILGLVVSIQLMGFKEKEPIHLVPYSTSYLLITLLVYHVLLRGVWAPVGWVLLGDILLHYINPLLLVVIHLFHSHSADHPKIPFSFIPRTLIAPAIYLLIILIIGEFTGRYPYPFLNVTNLGYPAVFVNALFIALGFMLVATVVMMLDWVVRWVRWTRNRIVT